MILGYWIDLPDIKINMLQSLPLENSARYSNIYALNQIDPDFKMENKKYNISCTYDGFTIVSGKFKKFCELQGYAGLEFIALPHSPGFYWFKVNGILEYDSKARETQFLNYNDTWKGYEEIIGATPVCLKEKIPLADNFFRTDICFGSFAGKSPVYLVGEATRRKLLAAEFKEIFFGKILDKYEWQKKN